MTWSIVKLAGFWRGGNSFSEEIIFPTNAWIGSITHAWSISQSLGLGVGVGVGGWGR
jgi:hypothetical protein